MITGVLVVAYSQMLHHPRQFGHHRHVHDAYHLLAIGAALMVECLAQLEALA